MGAPSSKQLSSPAQTCMPLEQGVGLLQPTCTSIRQQAGVDWPPPLLSQTLATLSQTSGRCMQCAVHECQPGKTRTQPDTCCTPCRLCFCCAHIMWQETLLQQKAAAAAGRSWASPGPLESLTHRGSDSLTAGGSWTLPAGTQHSPAHGRPAVLGIAGGIAGNATASSLLSSTGYSSMGASLGSSSGSCGSVAAAVAAAQEAAAAARAVEDRLVLAEGRSMAAERAALEAARAAEAAGQRVAVLSTQLAAAAMQVQEERSQREAVTPFNQQV